MITWKYSGLDSRGTPIKGSVSAANLRDANIKLMALGVAQATVTDPKADSGPAKPPAEQPLTPPGPVIAPKTESSIAPHPFQNTQKNNRREFLLVGPTTQVKGIIEPMLEARNGTIKHMVLHPDAHGKMEIAVVVECDRTE